MFKPAHANDYLDAIRLRMAEHQATFRQRVREINVASEGMGALSGSNHALRLAEVLRTCFPQAAADLLRALPAAHQIGGLDRRELIDLTGPRLVELLDVMIAITGLNSYIASVSNPAFREAIEQPIVECRSMIAVLIRQSQIGFDRIWSEEGAVVNNTINAGHIVGPIQQGTTHSTQHSSIAVDRTSLQGALSKLEEHLADPANDTLVVESLRSDIATIKLQLAKPEPSHGVLREVTKSMRNLVEGITGGLLTPAVHSAVVTVAALF